MFIEDRLLDCVSYGTEGGPTWATRKIGLRSGIIRRNPMRSRPLYRFGIIYSALKQTDHAEVIAAYNACRGGVHAFRLKDWADYTAAEELLGVLGTGAPQSVQLTKTYTFGAQEVARNIRKPVAGTVSMTADGAPLVASIDYTTGIATFTAAASDVLRWSGEFDVPVMFEDDQLSFAGVSRSEARGLMLTADISLIEDLSA